MKTKITLLLLLFSISLHIKAQSPEALAKYHFIEAQNAYGNGDNKTALTNLESTVEALGKTNSKIEALYTYVYYNKKDLIIAHSHMTKYFDIASEDHSDYMKMISLTTELNNKVKEEQKRQADMGFTDSSHFEEIASLGNDNDWVNKIETYDYASENSSNRQQQHYITLITKEYEKAKNYKSIPGKARLAYFYLRSFGEVEVDHNPEKAAELCLEGCKIKYPLATYVYARGKYYNNKDRNEDYLKLLKIVEGKIDLAYSELGHFYKSKIYKNDPYYKPNLAIDYFKKGFEKCLAEGQNIIASSEFANIISFTYRIEGNKDLNLQWLKKSYETSPNGFAAMSIAYFYLYNYKNPKYSVTGAKVASWNLKAAKLYYTFSMIDIGDYYSKGMYGYTLDKTKAIEWYTKAADRGSKSAIKKLRDLGVNYTSQ